jgi:hypothetical protein
MTVADTNYADLIESGSKRPPGKKAAATPSPNNEIRPAAAPAKLTSDASGILVRVNGDAAEADKPINMDDMKVFEGELEAFIRSNGDAGGEENGDSRA